MDLYLYPEIMCGCGKTRNYCTCIFQFTVTLVVICPLFVVTLLLHQCVLACHYSVVVVEMISLCTFLKKEICG